MDGSNSEEWAGEFPKRLRALHSHWLARGEEAIVIRGVNFRERGVDLHADTTRNPTPTYLPQTFNYR